MRKVLILTQNEIKKLITIKDAVRVIEKAFYAYGKNRGRMPAKVYLDLPEYKGDFRAMPAYIKDLKVCGMKWVCAYPDNRTFNLPSVMATLILNDPRNACPLAILEATHLTNMRTGAAGAVAAKYLARKDARVISLIGCGVQARFQVLAIKESVNLSSIKLWSINPKEMRMFKRELGSGKIPISLTESIRCGYHLHHHSFQKASGKAGLVKEGSPY